jgi:membrane-bound ClpP family serine protease
MLNVARSIAVFGIYLALSGLAFIFIPNVILPLFGFAATAEVWIRVVGLLAAILGFYFLYSVRHADHHFFRATVYARLMFFTGLVLFALLSWGSPMLVAFGLIDLAGAAWTRVALRESEPPLR